MIKICLLFVVVEKVDSSASLYSQSIQGHHMCLLVKQVQCFCLYRNIVGNLFRISQLYCNMFFRRDISPFSADSKRAVVSYWQKNVH